MQWLDEEMLGEVLSTGGCGGAGGGDGGDAAGWLEIIGSRWEKLGEGA